jgi:hypothetical protein
VLFATQLSVIQSTVPPNLELSIITAAAGTRGRHDGACHDLVPPLPLLAGEGWGEGGGTVISSDAPSPQPSPVLPRGRGGTRVAAVLLATRACWR